MADEGVKKILIDITEKEETKLSSDNNVVDITATGVLSVKNTSEESSLWTLKLTVNEKDFTDLPATADKENLAKGDSWDLEYKISGVDAPVLDFKEIVDTSKEKEGINHNFVLNTPDTAKVTFVLENKIDTPIKDIVVKKKFPEFLKEFVIVPDTENATIDFSTREFEWKVDELKPGEKKEVSVEARTEITDVEPKSMNEVIVEYVAYGNYRSKINPVIEAQSDTMSGIDTEEDDQTPNKWNCVLEFENESDFELTLRKAEVRHKTAVKEELVVDVSPNEIIKPGGSWSYDFSTYNDGVPGLEPRLDFTVNYEIEKKIIGKIVKEPLILNVLATETVKDINPPVVKANANTDMVITDIITNTGSAIINSVHLEDIIPADFEPPSIEKLTFELQNKSGGKIKEIGNEHLQMEITPDDTDPSKEHKIIADITNLADYFEPGVKLILRYPIVARNPKPNVRYETPVEILANTLPECVGYKDKPAETPVIGIQYVQRKVKTMKSISPAGEDSYKITVKITNKGGVELENISIVEEIPKGFIAMDFEPAEMKPEAEEKDGKTFLVWKIARLDPEKSLKLKYVCQGKGEFQRIEPKVIFAEGEGQKGGAAAATAKKGEVTGVAKLIADIFDSAVEKIKKGVPYSEAAKIMSEVRDQILEKGGASPALHKMAAEIREMEKMGDKMLFGDALDKFIQKVEEWKQALM